MWQLAFGVVRHSRVRPTPHAFVYPAFFARIPIHELKRSNQQGSAAAGVSTVRSGSMLFGVNKPNLLSFHERDHGDGYLDETFQSQGNWAWINTLLASAGLPAPTTVWLHAFPRVLGYAFKPVSFWYCHDKDEALMAIVAEVNNTFGERHCYLLSLNATGDGPPKFGQTLEASKVFHVSPFCKTEGRYRFRFLNTDNHTVARVDHDDEIGPLLLTSLSGTLTALTNKTVLRALIAYPLFTLGVMARIHWQAALLWIKRVPFISKPTPPANLISHH